MYNIDNNICFETRKHYASIDGFRAFFSLGIMIFHIQTNTHYQLSGFIWQKIIPSFNHLVLFFMMISAFGMCSGYLEKFHNKTVDLEQFFKRRYKKILPYYFFLIIIALIYEPSLTNFFDATMEVMLIYGLLPNNALNVIGVGWTIGVIFVFYLMFPAFTILLKTKKRAWIFLFLSLWVNYVCSSHYFSDIFVNKLFSPYHSFIYCIPFFLGGGLIFLYRNEITNLCSKYRYLVLLLCVICTIIYYISPVKIIDFGILIYKNFILYSLWLLYAVGCQNKLFGNKITSFLGGISLEIYLSHMFVFRFMERMHLQYLFGDKSWWSYIVLCFMTFIGLLGLIYGYKSAIHIVKNLVCKIRNKRNNKM